jgi:hypothetical protein
VKGSSTAITAVATSIDQDGTYVMAFDFTTTHIGFKSAIQAID